MTQKYEMNEKDIDSVIRYLKIVDPQNATPEAAIEILEEMYARVHTISHENPELLEQVYKDLKTKKSQK